MWLIISYFTEPSPKGAEHVDESHILLTMVNYHSTGLSHKYASKVFIILSSIFQLSLDKRINCRIFYYDIWWQLINTISKLSSHDAFLCTLDINRVGRTIRRMFANIVASNCHHAMIYHHDDSAKILNLQCDFSCTTEIISWTLQKGAFHHSYMT